MQQCDVEGQKDIPRMKNKFVVTHRYTILQKKLDRSLIDKHFSMLYFYGSIRKHLYGEYILREAVFLNQLSCIVGTSD